MIVLYTMPLCSECEKVKKLLKRWGVTFDEQPLLLWQNLHPGKQWMAPILDVEGNKYYEYNEIDRAEKLYAIIENQVEFDDEKQNNKPTKQRYKIRTPMKKSRKDWFTLTLEGEARINVTILRMINGVDTYAIIRGWSEKEKEAALIMWRLAQHNKAHDFMLYAEMLTSKAKAADPYMEKNNGTIETSQSMDTMEE